MGRITDFDLELHTRKDGSDYLAIGNPTQGPHEQFNFNGSHEIAEEIVSRFNSHASLVEEVEMLRKALREVMFLAETEHVCLSSWNASGGPLDYDGIMERASTVLEKSNA